MSFDITTVVLVTAAIVTILVYLRPALKVLGNAVITIGLAVAAAVTAAWKVVRQSATDDEGGGETRELRRGVREPVDKTKTKAKVSSIQQTPRHRG